MVRGSQLRSIPHTRRVRLPSAREGGTTGGRGVDLGQGWRACLCRPAALLKDIRGRQQAASVRAPMPPSVVVLVAALVAALFPLAAPSALGAWLERNGAGSYEATITVTPVDNSISDGNADLTISLTGENIGVGGDGIDLTSVKLTIIDDDCPIVIDDTALWTAQYLYSLTGPPATEIALTKVADNQWYLPTTWGYNAVSWLTGNPAYDGLYVFDAVITLNPADLTCTIEGTSGLTPGGDTGSYDPCANTFTFSSLNDELFSGGGIDAGFTLTGK